MYKPPSPLTSPTLRDDLPRYPPLIQVCRITTDTLPPPSELINSLYISYTQQSDPSSMLPRDREVCAVLDLDPLLAKGFDYRICRLVGAYINDTTVPAGITGNASPQVITPASMIGIIAGMVLLIDPGTEEQEQSVVDSITATTFTATILHNHAVDVVVVAECPLYYNRGQSILDNTVAFNDLTGLTAAQTIVTYTPTVDGTYRIGGYLNITAIVGGTYNWSLTWTDEAGNARTVNYIPLGAGGVSIGAVGFKEFPDITIRAKGTNAITLAFVNTIAGVSITYDAGGTIEFLR